VQKPELYFRLNKERAVQTHVCEVEDVDVMHELIQGVPAVWGWKGWIDGELSAPMRMIRDGTAMRELWLELGDFSGGYPFTVSMSDRIKDIVPDICALFIDKRNPGYVRFDKAGYLPRNKQVTFEAARRLAAHYVLRGYRGHLSFVSAGHKGNMSENPLSCDMRLEVWKNGPHPEVGIQPPRIRLQWRREYGGARDGIESLEAVCRKHGLKEYEFIGAGDYYRKFERQLELPFEQIREEPLVKLVEPAVLQAAE